MGSGRRERYLRRKAEERRARGDAGVEIYEEKRAAATMLQKVHRGKIGRREFERQKRKTEREKREEKRLMKARARRIEHQLQVYSRVAIGSGAYERAIKTIARECVEWIEAKPSAHEFHGRYEIDLSPWRGKEKESEREIDGVLSAVEAFYYAVSFKATSMRFQRSLFPILGSAISKQTYLTTLDLEGCQLTAHACNLIFRGALDGSCKSLQVLNLAKNYIARGERIGSNASGLLRGRQTMRLCALSRNFSAS